MERLSSQFPTGIVLDEDGNAPWPHSVIDAADPSPATHAVNVYSALHGSGDDTAGFDQIEFATVDPVHGKIPGFTMEALLAIVAHRLAGFQSGPFACKENGTALTHVQFALSMLHERSRRLAVERRAAEIDVASDAEHDAVEADRTLEGDEERVDDPRYD